MTSSQTPEGLSVTTTYTPRRVDTAGELTVTIDDYQPDVTSGFNEPGEAADVSLVFESDTTDESVTSHARIVALAPQLRPWPPSDGHEWVREAWAYEIDADGESTSSHGSLNYLFQFSTADDLLWDDLLEEVTENAHLVL